jgi:hypothetical protein
LAQNSESFQLGLSGGEDNAFVFPPIHVFDRLIVSDQPLRGFQPDLARV